MKIIDKPIDEIQEYENNPRKNDEAVDVVAKSITAFGFKVPIVLDKKGVIIAGHTRYKAAKSLGMKTVPCVIASDLSQVKAKAYRLADNRTAEIADWDTEKLHEELAELELAEFDMSDFDFPDLEKMTDVKEQTVKTKFAVIVDCPNEKVQAELFDTLSEMGYEPRLQSL